MIGSDETTQMESEPQLAEAPAANEPADDGALDKVVVSQQEQPPAASLPTAPTPTVEENITGTSVDKEKHVGMLKAWEEEQKNLLQNKAHKKIASLTARKNEEVAVFDAKLRALEGSEEKKKERQAEKMKNKIARIHRRAEEKKAAIEAKLDKQMLRIEEISATHLAKGTAPDKISSWFCGRVFSKTHV